MAKRKLSNSRAARWGRAVGKVQTGIEAIRAALDSPEIAEGIDELRELKEEYEGWKDNLPENLQSSPLGEKLEAVCDLDLDDLVEEIESAVSSAEDKVGEAEGIDLPQGFGRD